jgi:hypothetical protein
MKRLEDGGLLFNNGYSSSLSDSRAAAKFTIYTKWRSLTRDAAVAMHPGRFVMRMVARGKETLFLNDSSGRWLAASHHASKSDGKIQMKLGRLTKHLLACSVLVSGLHAAVPVFSVPGLPVTHSVSTILSVSGIP